MRLANKIKVLAIAVFTALLIGGCGGGSVANSSTTDRNNTLVPTFTKLTVEADRTKTATLTASDDSGSNKLTFSMVSQPQHGTINLDANGSLRYTPDPNFSGSDYFTYRVSDQADNSVEQNVTIIVVDMNEAPVPTFTTLRVQEDTNKTAALTATDDNNDTLTFIVVTRPQHGTLKLEADGSFLYTPNYNFNGSDSFTYKVNDGRVDSKVQSVAVTVISVNDLPVPTFTTLRVQEDTTKRGILTATDEDNDTVSFSIATQPLNGTISLDLNGSFTYTPKSNFNGSDSFTYRVSDGMGGSATQRVAITVTIINDAPTATFTTLTVQEDINKTATLTASDVDGNDALTFTLVSQPQHATINLEANGSFIYSPNSNFNGSDSFSYKVNDGTVDSAVQSVAVTVVSINDAPTPTFTTLTVQEDINKIATLTATDVDNNNSSLTFRVATRPQHGTLNLEANGNFTYTPDLNFNGSDSFSYRVSDGVSNSVEQNVTITVVNVNDVPVATLTTLTLQEDSTKAATLTATDDDNDTLIFSVVTEPQHGTLVLDSNGSFSYTPTPNFNGSDSFAYKVNDGVVDSVEQNVTITVTAVNDALLPTFTTLTLQEDTNATAKLTAINNDNNSFILIFSIVTMPQHGTIDFDSNGSFVYTPNPNFSGSDSFIYKASDGITDSKEQIVAITVTNINDAPVATFTTLRVEEDTTKVAMLTANDFDGDTLTFTVVTQPQNGTLNLDSNGSFSYTPNSGFYGSDSFTYKVNDGIVDSAEQSVTITVINMNNAPVPTSTTLMVQEDTPKREILTATDDDNDTLTFSIVTQPQNGVIKLNSNGRFTYTPNANFNGSDYFTYKVNDGRVDSAEQNLLVIVANSNDAPTPTFTTLTVEENITKRARLTATDDDNDTLTFSVVTQPQYGTLTLDVDGRFSYTPNSSFRGRDSFTYRVNDGKVDSSEQSVDITVVNPSSLPTSTFTTLTVEANSIKKATLTTTANNNTLRFSVVAMPQNGILNLDTNGSFTYTPNSNFRGSDYFTYKVNDGRVDGATQSVLIIVVNANSAP